MARARHVPRTPGPAPAAAFVLLTLASLTSCAATSQRWFTARPDVTPDAKDARFMVSVPTTLTSERGSLIGLYASVSGTADRRLVGYGLVVQVLSGTLVVSAVHLEPGHRDQVLDAGRLPDRPRVGAELGHVVEQRDGVFVVNLGAADGVVVGDLYEVLGAPVSDVGLNGPSLGRRVVGLLEVVEAPEGNLTATARLLEGEATRFAWVQHAGRSLVVGQRKAKKVKVLLVHFKGKQGRLFSETLNDRLSRGLSEHTKGSISVKHLDAQIDDFDPDHTHARALGKKHGADLVVWGSVRCGESMACVMPRITFVWPKESQERLRNLEELTLPAERVREGQEAGALDVRVRGLATRLVGMAYFEADDYANAAYHLGNVPAAAATDYALSRDPLFLTQYHVGRWAAAESTAREIVAEGVRDQDATMEAHGHYRVARTTEGLGRWSEATDEAKRARELFLSQSMTREAAAASSVVARIKAYRGDVNEALRLHHEQLAILGALGDQKGWAVTLGDIARIKTDKGKVDEALRLHQEQLGIFEALGDRRERAVTLGDIARIKTFKGEVDEALRLHQEQLAIFEALGDRLARAVPLGAIARIMTNKGKVDEALCLHEEQLAIVEALGDRKGRAVTLRDIARIKSLKGEVDEALRLHQEQLAIVEALGDQKGRAATLGDIARILRSKGDVDEALRLHEQALAVYEALGDQRARAVTLDDIANIKADKGDMDEAVRLHVEQLAIAEELGDADGVAHAHWGIAQIAAHRGNLAAAAQHLAIAFELNVRMDRIVGIVIVGREYAVVLKQLGLAEDARAAIDVIRKHAARAPPFLSRVLEQLDNLDQR